MKTTHYKYLFFVLISIFFTACIEIEITTILNPDGSMERILEIKSDKKLKEFNELPFPVDSTWEISEQVDTAGEKKEYLYTIKKFYKNAAQINLDYKNVPNSMSRIDRKVIVEKKFRWFYTYITYKEEYKKMAKLDYKPFTEYLTEQEKEIRKYEGNDSIEQILDIDSAELKSIKKTVHDKSDKWFEDNIYTELIHAIDLDFKDFDIKSVSKKDIENQIDTIKWFTDSIGENIQKKLYPFLDELFNTNELSQIANAEKSYVNQFEEDINYILEQKEFKYKLIMPGLLIETNASTIKAEELSWQVEPIEIYFNDTSHFAEARMINTWAYVVSGVFILLVIILLFISIFRKR